VTGLLLLDPAFFIIRPLISNKCFIHSPAVD